MSDRSAPGVRITRLADEHASSGEPLALGDRLLSFAYEDAENKTDKVSIQLDNFDLSLFDREDLAGGTVLQVSWGYPDNMAPPRRVVIKKTKGFTALTLEGQSLSVLMNQQQKTRNWKNVSRSEIARIIAGEYGYGDQFIHIDDDGGERLDVVNQTAETDARFLRRLAGKQGFELYVDDTGFHFHKRELQTPPIKVFTWYADPGRGDVLSVNMESDLSVQTGKVTTKRRDPMNRTTTEHVATNKDTDRTTLSQVIEVVDPETGSTSLQARNATQSVHSTTAQTDGEAKAEAKARYRKAEQSTIKLSMQVVGDPSLRAKSIIEVQGISKLLSGKYYVTEVKHTISSSGYVCDLKLTSDGVGRAGRKQGQEQEGEKNDQAPAQDGELRQIEVVDQETGATRIEYRK